MDSLRSILVDLLVPDRAAEATAKMAIYKKDPSLLPNLMKLSLDDTEPSIRQMSAVILRKETSKRFSTLSGAEQQQFRDAIILALTREQHAATWSALCEVAATLLRKDATWPAFFRLVQSAVESPTDVARGAELLARMASSAPGVIRNATAASQSLKLVETCLNHQSVEAKHHALRAYNAIIGIAGDTCQKQIKSLVKASVGAIETCAQTGESDWATEGFQVMESLLEAENGLINESLVDLIRWSAMLLANTETDDTFRCVAGNFLVSAVNSKPKAIKKRKMTADLLKLCFPILGEDDAEDDDEDDDTPRTISLQLLDAISIKLPNTEVLPVVLEYAQQASQGSTHDKRSALAALAVVCEGCSSAMIEGEHVKSLIEFACTSLQSGEAALRASALYAIGQFAEQMMGAITEYAVTILQLVTQLLSVSPTIEELFKHQILEKGLYCIEQLVDTLETDDMRALLPDLFKSILRFIQAGNTDKSQTATLAISTLSSIIAAAQELIAPHLNDCVQMLQTLLPSGPSTEDTDAKVILVQSGALDALATMAVAAGEDFLPLAGDSLKMAGNLVANDPDPDIRRAALNLSCAVLSIPNAPAEMLCIVPQVMKCLEETLKSNEGIGVKFVGDADENDPDAAASAFEAIESLDDSEDLGEGEEGDVEEVEHFTVENSYIEEKHSALSSLIRMAQKIPQQIGAISEGLFDQCIQLTDFINEDIRRFSAAAALHVGQAIYLVKNNIEPLELAVTKAAELVLQDPDESVSMLIMSELAEVLDSHKKPLQTLKVIECVKNTMSGELICMLDDDDEGEVVREEEEASEVERELLDSAGELLSAAARQDPAGVIEHGLVDILTASVVLLKKPDAGSKACSLGILADLFSTLGGNSCEPFLKQLMPAFSQFTGADDDNVRNNATFGIGVIIYTGGETGRTFIEEALSKLPINETKNTQVKDNVTGAIARCLCAGENQMKAKLSEQLLMRLPLTEDHAEWGAVLRAIEQLIQLGDSKTLAALPELAKSCLDSVSHLNVDIVSDRTTLTTIGVFINAISKLNQPLFDQIKQTTPERTWIKLNKAQLA